MYSADNRNSTGLSKSSKMTKFKDFSVAFDKTKNENKKKTINLKSISFVPFVACNKQSRQCSTSQDVAGLILDWAFGSDAASFFCEGEGGWGDDIIW